MRCSIAEKGKTMRIKYDQEFMKSPEGKSLNSRWRNIRNQRCEEWEDFQAFVDWALANGFGLELQLKRHDNRVPYQPGNAYFLKPDVEDGTIGESIKRWNDTVNKIRKHYGLEPLGVDNG